MQLDITWEASARSVLTTKLRALERVLAQRQEILAALRPVPAAVVRTWAPPEQGSLQVGGVGKRRVCGPVGGCFEWGRSWLG